MSQDNFFIEVFKDLKKRITGRRVALFITLLLALSVGLWAPMQGQVIIFKICLVTLASLVGYWIDRMIFPYARIHVMKAQFDFSEQMDKSCQQMYSQNFNIAQIRRALIVLAAILGVCLGL